MSIKTLTISFLLMAIAIDSATAQNFSQRGVRRGAIAGAVVGGLIGANNDRTALGIIAGGVGGAVIGRAIGEQKDRQLYQQYQYQSQYPNYHQTPYQPDVYQNNWSQGQYGQPIYGQPAYIQPAYPSTTMQPTYPSTIIQPAYPSTTIQRANPPTTIQQGTASPHYMQPGLQSVEPPPYAAPAHPIQVSPIQSSPSQAPQPNMIPPLKSWPHGQAPSVLESGSLNSAPNRLPNSASLPTVATMKAPTTIQQSDTTSARNLNKAFRAATTVARGLSVLATEAHEGVVQAGHNADGETAPGSVLTGRLSAPAATNQPSQSKVRMQSPRPLTNQPYRHGW